MSGFCQKKFGGCVTKSALKRLMVERGKLSPLCRQQTDNTKPNTKAMTSKEFHSQILPLGDKMYRLARAIVGASGAEDVVQDVMERLWRGREGLRPNNCEAFVMRSVRNRSLDVVGGERLRNDKKESVAYELYTTSTSPEENFDLRELADRIVATLPEQQQTILHLRDVEGYDFDIIAEVVGMEVGTVRVNLSRARREVKEQLQRALNYGL